jgi:transposase
MEKSKTKKRQHRKYDEGFKNEAIKMVITGRSVPEVSKTLGIGESLLYRWRTEHQSHQTPSEQGLNSENEQLRKQIKTLELERDILKKALHIVGRVT